MKKLEVMVRQDLIDSFAESVRRRVRQDLGIEVGSIQTKRIYDFDVPLSEGEFEKARKEIFTDGEVNVSSFGLIELPYDYLIHITWKPGVTDNRGRVSIEALEDLFKKKFRDDEKVYTSLQILLKGNLTREQAEKIGHLYANETVQDMAVWDSSEKPEFAVPKIINDSEPKVEYINLNVSDEELLDVSRKKKLALNLGEMKAIKGYYQKPEVISERGKIGMKPMPTDVELEILAQTWSEHCKHKIFNALITDVNGRIFEGIPDYEKSINEVSKDEQNRIMVDSIFDAYIKKPALELKERLPWVKSILKDNAGVVDFDDNWLYTLKWESHNSPSAKEPYGGAYTGIVGVFRDPMGTGRGGKIISGFWSFHTGSPLYKGDLNPDLHPSQILEGVRRGVEEGGNRSGNPTVTGFTYFDEGFIGKPYIGVGASSIIPKTVNGKPGWEKIIEKDDLAIVVGGRVGADGIHGATESSLEGGKHISAGHVQVGDAYMQKKVQEFLIEARDRHLYEGIQDFGAGGVSSAFGELAEFTNGLDMDISKHPVKYEGLVPWQMMVSESQERMGITTKPGKLEELQKLAEKHGVEITVLGTFNDRGKLFIKHKETPCVYLNMEFLHDGGPRFELEAEWLTPEDRNLKEPEIQKINVLKELLSSDNIASCNYIVRQFDHEVQGGSAIKPLVGVREDVHGDASVTKPVLGSDKGIAFATGENPQYGKIDAYHMALNNIDETIRRVIAVGGGLNQVPLNDNFGWPSPIPSGKNPDAKYKTAQLWRAAKAVADGARGYSAPCISGKDSMSMDGTIPLKKGGERRVSAPAIVQISTAALIQDVRYCLTMDAKKPGDLVYVLGMTKDELGGSAYYSLFNELGKNVPVVDIVANIKLYDAHSKAVKELLIESSHGVYRGGLAVHAALVAIAGGLGMEIDLSKVPNEDLSADKILYSESAGRLIVTVDPGNKGKFEQMMEGNDFALVGRITEEKRFKIIGADINESIDELRKAYHKTYDGELNGS